MHSFNNATSTAAPLPIITLTLEKSLYNLLIKSNLSSAKLLDKSSVFKSDFCDYLKNCNEKFDLIFLDPPYSKNFYKTALDLICKKRLLNEDGFIIVEWDSEIGFQNEISDFEVYKEKCYGRANITVLKWG